MLRKVVHHVSQLENFEKDFIAMMLYDMIWYDILLFSDVDVTYSFLTSTNQLRVIKLEAASCDPDCQILKKPEPKINESKLHIVHSIILLSSIIFPLKLSCVLIICVIALQRFGSLLAIQLGEPSENLFEGSNPSDAWGRLGGRSDGGVCPAIAASRKERSPEHHTNGRGIKSSRPP